MWAIDLVSFRYISASSHIEILNLRFMTIALSDQDYQQLWQEMLCSNISPHTDPADTIWKFPHQLGIGYKRVIQLRGILLEIHNYNLHDDLSVQFQPSSTAECEFGFQISGARHGMRGGQNFLAWGWGTGGTWEALAGEKIVKVDIHLESPSQLISFITSDRQQLPTQLKQLIEGVTHETYEEIGTIATTMQLPLEQILHCPYQGLTRQIYLESKCLELIALQLEQLATPQKCDRSQVLKGNDIDRIHQAREILICKCDRPPSLMELARQVGLNDYKLKLGFRQVFGTTVFGYLHTYRLERSRQLLETGQMSVGEVMRTVGYANRGHFATAFKRRFGVNPKTYLSKQ